LKGCNNYITNAKENNLLLIFIFICNYTFGQFTDSVVIDSYDDAMYNFNFFRKNNIKKIKHFEGFYENGKPSSSYLEYTAYYDKKRNLIILRYSKSYKIFYKEGKYGQLIHCDESGDYCSDQYEYDSKGNIIWDQKLILKYDSLNRIVLVTDTTQYNPYCLWHKEYTYIKDKLQKVEEFRCELYSKDINESIVDLFYYKSMYEFGYLETFPKSWKKQSWKYDFKISKHKKKLETYYYDGDELTLKYTDIIIKKHLHLHKI